MGADTVFPFSSVDIRVVYKNVYNYSNTYPDYTFTEDYNCCIAFVASSTDSTLNATTRINKKSGNFTISTLLKDDAEYVYNGTDPQTETSVTVCKLENVKKGDVVNLGGMYSPILLILKIS